ncbi:SdiA-regulated domain-containing protein [Gillisia sp. CAL575]|uniref:SdiA-regulated domain-containing protein n=1 Tax=Gillisia sp. CAL575 TaxID=985255 RepID=UPI0003A0267B|nr:SdiA-regulated domain-containing protein [Gillisia sp. CAL575]
MNKIAILIIFGVFALVALIYYSFDGIAPNRDFPGAKNIQIDKKWNMPIVLEEISGISWMDKDHIACVEDEEAIIFIYNLTTSKIEKQIVFGEDGDYEGIALVDSDAYVLRSDGVIFEVLNFQNDSLVINEYSTGMTKEYEWEGITWDKKRNRLLLSIKDKADKESKPIYAFNLKTKMVEEKPAYQINFNDPAFKILEQEINQQIIEPSEVAVHPFTGEIYVLEANKPKLLILNSNGTIKKLHVLREEQFGQPEGLTFDDQGNLYISNEGSGGLGNILKVNLDKVPEKK